MHDRLDPSPTELLLTTRAGGASSASDRERLFVLIYDDLRRLAGSLMRREDPGHTLRPTALVHELYLRLVDQTRVDVSDRARFMGLAAKAMRHILIDEARRANAQRRGGGWQRVTLHEDLDGCAGAELDMIALEQAMGRLTAEDERAASVAELRLFTGLTMPEIAELLDVSERTAAGDWAFARRYLARALS